MELRDSSLVMWLLLKYEDLIYHTQYSHTMSDMLGCTYNSCASQTETGWSLRFSGQSIYCICCKWDTLFQKRKTVEWHLRSNVWCCGLFSTYTWAQLKCLKGLWIASQFYTGSCRTDQNCNSNSLHIMYKFLNFYVTIFTFNKSTFPIQQMIIDE